MTLKSCAILSLVVIGKLLVIIIVVLVIVWPSVSTPIKHDESVNLCDENGKEDRKQQENILG